MRSKFVHMLALMAVGCSAGTVPESSGVGAQNLWFSAASPFYAAQQAWGLPAAVEPELVVEYANLVQRDCHVRDGYTALGCLLEDRSAIIIQPLNKPMTAGVLLHEVGHLLAGRTHIDSNGPVDGCGDGITPSLFVMCTYGSTSGELTQEDLEWAQ